MKPFPEDATDVTWTVDVYRNDEFERGEDCEDLDDAIHTANAIVDRTLDGLEVCTLVRVEGYTDEGERHHERIAYIRGIPSLRIQRVISEHFTFNQDARR